MGKSSKKTGGLGIKYDDEKYLKYLMSRGKVTSKWLFYQNYSRMISDLTSLDTDSIKYFNPDSDSYIGYLKFVLTSMVDINRMTAILNTSGGKYLLLDIHNVQNLDESESKSKLAVKYLIGDSIGQLLQQCSKNILNFMNLKLPSKLSLKNLLKTGHSNLTFFTVDELMSGEISRERWTEYFKKYFNCIDSQPVLDLSYLENIRSIPIVPNIQNVYQLTFVQNCFMEDFSFIRAIKNLNIVNFMYMPNLNNVNMPEIISDMARHKVNVFEIHTCFNITGAILYPLLKNLTCLNRLLLDSPCMKFQENRFKLEVIGKEWSELRTQQHNILEHIWINSEHLTLDFIDSLLEVLPNVQNIYLNDEVLAKVELYIKERYIDDDCFKFRSVSNRNLGFNISRNSYYFCGLDRHKYSSYNYSSAMKNIIKEKSPAQYREILAQEAYVENEL